jgi:hypothetical protein
LSKSTVCFNSSSEPTRFAPVVSTVGCSFPRLAGTGVRVDVLAGAGVPAAVLRRAMKAAASSLGPRGHA